MESKPVTNAEMQLLMKRSADPVHPYYYRFNYSLNQSTVVAYRSRKSILSSMRSSSFSVAERTLFHTVHVDEGHPLADSTSAIEKAKNRIGAFAYAR